MKKELINIVIGIVLCFVGYYLYFINYVFLNYLGLIFIIYGVFVVIVKVLIILFLFNGKFKSIREFENNEKLTIPNFINEILKFRIKKNKEIAFEIPFYGTFTVFNYNNKIKDNLNNPIYIQKEINDIIKESFFPIYNFSKIIPFATNNNYIVLFFEEGKDELNVIDLNNSNLKPFKLNNKLNFYLDIKNLTFQNNLYSYNGLKKIETLLSENEYFYDVPDCIFEGKDYLEIFRKSFQLLDFNIDYSILNIEEKDDQYFLEIKIENQLFKTFFNKYSHYIDNERITIVLNEILTLLKHIPSKKYYLISNSFCDFGIVLADQNTYQILNENGCIEFDAQKQEMTAKEIEIIRKHQDLNREIDNIKYRIEVINQIDKKELKRGNQYQFSYETNYCFDQQGIAELKKSLKVEIVKITSGYEIFFIK